MSLKFKIPITLTELTINITLQCGQSFRWRKVSENTWKGVLGSTLWILSQDSKFLHCEAIENNSKNIKKKKKHYESAIKDYFRLNIDLTSLYQKWNQADKTFAAISKDFEGIRILQQHPVENTFSFICSSNNNILRIASLVNRLCSEFGEKVVNHDGEDFFSFPSPEALAQPGTEEKLRQLGFGYRAKYIESSARTIVEKGGEKWLHSLRETTYEECHSSLLELCGIGPKVADCICLMSMNHLHAIPVDTHVFQIAARDYLPQLRGAKSVTKKIYTQIGDHFRLIFGPYAGWAHSVLFSADLKKFQNKLDSENGPPKKKVKIKK